MSENQAAEKLEETADLDRMLQLLQSWALLHAFRDGKTKLPKLQEPGKDKGVLQKKKKQQEECPVIAVAKDEAFCFYYEDNLRLLEEQGARLCYFSPLHDSRLPEGCDGILLGGGYPELHLQELEQNGSMRNEIRTAMEQDIPCVAECGGFMYLHETIEDQEGQQYRMAGVLPGICINKGKLVRFGYIELQEKKPSFLPEGTKIRGHEFHYYDSSDNGEDCMAVKPVTGKSYPCVIEIQNRFLGFPHLYYPSNPGFAENFVEKARDFRNRNQSRNQNRNQYRNRDRKR